MVVAGGLVLLMLLVGMRRSLLDPISELTTRALLVGSREDLDVRLNSQRRDELGLLAREFDRMVERLAEARRQLVEHSYRSGVAEMASGVLHNIGNALTPLGVKLSNLRAALSRAPVQEVGLAAAELSEPGSDTERRADLQAFVALSGQELADLVRRAEQDLGEVQANLDHIQQILADQHRFSRAERAIEPVLLAPLVQESVGLLPDDLKTVARVELAPELERVGPARAARVALQQVVSNLLINAAEAILAAGDRPLPGLVRVTAGESLVDGRPMVHLRFTDDGVGIPAEDLSRVFQRGFSTKARGSGTGLHWSANTIQTLGGRLFAESDGPGRGASFHLLLPSATKTRPRLQEVA
jgi:signal transduction histidine kinase